MVTQQQKHGSKYRHTSSRNGRSSSKRKKLILILSVALAVSFLLNLVLGVKLGNFAREATLQTVIEQKLQRELAEIKPLLKAMENEVKTLTSKRLPGLVELTYDAVLQINKRYVKNIVFTRTGKVGVKRYEYKIVMDNRNLMPVRPEVRILFFDRVGIQVGFSELGMGNGLPIADHLERGEIRAYSSAVELADDIEPKYFQIQLFSPDLSG